MITAEKFLNYAKRIVTSSSISEEECRTAIGRAYYALYHETLAVTVKRHSFALIKNIEKKLKRSLKPSEKALLASLDPVFLSRCNLHQILPNTLWDIKEPVIALSFKNFRDKRNQADYDLRLTLSYNDANAIVNNIDGLVNQVKFL